MPKLINPTIEELMALAPQIPGMREEYTHLEQEYEKRKDLPAKARLEVQLPMADILDTIHSWEYEMNVAIYRAEKAGKIRQAVNLAELALKYSTIYGAANACLDSWATDEDGNDTGYNGPDEIETDPLWR